MPKAASICSGVKPHQLACCRGGAEDADRRRAMPAAIERARERDAARYVEPQRNRQQQIPPGDAAEAVAHGQSRAQHRDAGMDRAAGVQRVVEIQRMTHAGVQQRRLRRRQADAAQQDAAFRPARPSGRSPRRARRSPANRCRRACSRRCRECRGGRIRRRSRADPHSRCGKHAGPAPKRDHRSSSFPIIAYAGRCLA